MGDKKKSKGPLPAREPILSALLDSPDADAVLRHWVIAATVQLAETLPTYVLAHALNDAKRRVREVVGDHAEIYVEPELVRDTSETQPPTDVIVIKASD